MCELRNYMTDGVNWQAQSVLAYLRGSEQNIFYKGGIDGENGKNYIAVNRLEAEGHSGYVFSLIINYKQVKHAWVFEHKNADDICVKFFETTFCGAPTYEHTGMKSKSDYDMSTGCGHIQDVAESVAWMFIRAIRNYKSENNID